MLPYNTLQILKNLSKSEIKKLGDFIRSPYFNSKDVLYQLYKEIVKHYPDFESEKIASQKIYKKIYRDKVFKEKTIKNLYSDFGVLLKKFVAYERLGSREREYNLSLIQGLQDKKCYEQSNKAITDNREKMMLTASYEEESFYDLYSMDTIQYLNLLGMNKINLDVYHELLNSINDNLTIFYLQTLFLTAKEDSILTQGHRVKKENKSINEIFIENFNAESFFNQVDKEESVIGMKIYYLMYWHAKNEISETQFREFEKLILSNIEKLSNEFRINCWANLLEIIILKLIPKDKKFYKDAFRVNDYFIKLNLYRKEGRSKLPISTFRNIFAIALFLKKYDWLEEFIISHTQFLQEEAKDNETNYSMGRLSFQLKKYEESLSYLNKVKFQQISEKVNIKYYYLMNYIELKSYSAALSMLSSIKHLYLNSKEMSQMLSLPAENSLKFFREIIRAEEHNSKIDYAIFKEAQTAGRYYQKQYILNKLEKLK